MQIFQNQKKQNSDNFWSQAFQMRTLTPCHCYNYYWCPRSYIKSPLWNTSTPWGVGIQFGTFLGANGHFPAHRVWLCLCAFIYFSHGRQLEWLLVCSCGQHTQRGANRRTQASHGRARIRVPGILIVKSLFSHSTKALANNEWMNEWVNEWMKEQTNQAGAPEVLF
jgi:hypothetical protein